MHNGKYIRVNVCECETIYTYMYLKTYVNKYKKGWHDIMEFGSVPQYVNYFSASKIHRNYNTEPENRHFVFVIYIKKYVKCKFKHIFK